VLCFVVFLVVCMLACAFFFGGMGFSPGYFLFAPFDLLFLSSADGLRAYFFDHLRL